MNLLNILLQAQQGNSWSGMLLILAMIVVFYFFMIRPQSKKQKEIKKAREALKSGDKIVTAGGIHGRIKDISETTMNRAQRLNQDRQGFRLSPRRGRHRQEMTS